LKFFLQLSVS